MKKLYALLGAVAMMTVAHAQNTMSATLEGVVESSCSVCSVSLGSDSLYVEKLERGYWNASR